MAKSREIDYALANDFAIRGCGGSSPAKKVFGVRRCSRKFAAQACLVDVYCSFEEKLLRVYRCCSSASLALTFAHIEMHRVALPLVAFACNHYIELTSQRHSLKVAFMPIVNVWRSNLYSETFLSGQDSMRLEKDSWSLQIRIFPHI